MKRATGAGAGFSHASGFVISLGQPFITFKTLFVSICRSEQACIRFLKKILNDEFFLISERFVSCAEMHTRLWAKLPLRK